MKQDGYLPVSNAPDSENKTANSASKWIKLLVAAIVVSGFAIAVNGVPNLSFTRCAHHDIHSSTEWKTNPIITSHISEGSRDHATISGFGEIAPDPKHLVVAQHAAVACDVPLCSTMATEILKRGGSAIDAAITTALCIGTVNAYSSGLGGGGFMTVRHENGTALAFNFRETAPRKSHKNMYDEDPVKAQVGGLAVGVPGELAGLYEAYSRYSSGKLTWSELIKPVIDLNREGFPIAEPLAAALLSAGPKMMKQPDEWPQYMTKDDTGHHRMLTLGETVRRPALAKTLEQIASNGSAAIFYDPEGPFVKELVHTANKHGGILEPEDFAGYKVIISEPVRGNFMGREVLTTPNPSSGPVLLLGLNVLGKFPKGTEFGEVETQRLIEIMKWMAAGRTELGDPFDVYNARAEEIMSDEWAERVFSKISDNSTLPWQEYEPSYEPNDPHGTSHFSILDEHGMAVSMTTTVNLQFGALIADPVTGIVLNSEMDDFSLPNRDNAYLLRPSIYNYVSPFKRPLSSTTPTIVSYNGIPELVIGASGGSHIVTAVFQGIARVYNYEKPLLYSISAPRIHHQLLPEIAYVEPGVPLSILGALVDIGHQVSYMGPVTTMNGLYRNAESGTIHAVSDYWRKRGRADGY